MSAGLIKHLKDKTEQDPNTKILMSQWEFDEKLVGKSLENVGSYYPHFSSHNESHSQQILVNIERLLGDNISKLTATDTWLILEAAYWHDIGMLFSADDVQEVVNNEEFKGYVEELANNNAQDLHEFAKVWHNEGWEVALVSYDNPYKGVEKYRQMVAEWYRQGHPDNSHQVVLKPFEKLNISSPRTELLPKRIYRYLAQICLSHGKSFNYVMSELPFRQTGMGTENCHPRFVACMLRLGDLFDIDDNRFCPVMARQVGNMPSLSETHKHKHQAIREFQLDNETVSVTAICNTEMSYIECRRWFDWIKEEIQDQMSQWKNIVPSRDFGLLPTINKLDVEMADSKILLNNKPMKFSLDERSAIELLQGNNLYKNELNIYREIFQNAVDATYIRVWYENFNTTEYQKSLSTIAPSNEVIREALLKYPISINFNKIKDEDDSDYSIWKFSIKDMGTGISLQDLQHMQKIAGSGQNKFRNKLINNMPVWMRPSGSFGVGLHSVFLLLEDSEHPYDKIYIKTRSFFDNNSYEIEMTSPISKHQGFCFIKQNTDDYQKDIGTTLSFFLRIKRRGVRYNSYIKHSLNDSIRDIYAIQNAYDPLLKPIHDYLTIIKIINEIKDKIIKNSYISTSINTLSNNTNLEDNKEKLIWDSEFNLFFFIEDLNYIDFLTDGQFGTKNSFKGQSVEPLSRFSYIPLNLDFYGFNAKDSLTLDRNDWRRSFRNKIYKEEYLDKLIKHLLENHYDKVKYQLNNNLLLNSFLYSFGINKNEDWMNLSLFNKKFVAYSKDLKEKTKFKDLLDLDNFSIIVKSYSSKELDNYIDKDASNTIVTNELDLESFWIRTFIEFWYENSGHHTVEELNDKEELIYSFKKNNEGNNLVSLYMQDFMSSDNPRITFTKNALKRLGLEEFSHLCCSSVAHYNIVGKNNSNHSIDSLLMPFTLFIEDDQKYITTNALESLVHFVYEELKKSDPALTIDQINKSYEELILKVDEKMNGIDEWRELRENGKNFTPRHIDNLNKKYNFTST